MRTDEKLYTGGNEGYIFAYNTLKVGEKNSYPFDEFRVECYKAITIGTLYHGDRMLVLDGMNFVSGELHKYKNFGVILFYMDRIERYYHLDESRSLYLRREIDVTYVKNGIPCKQKAYAYVYNDLMKERI